MKVATILSLMASVTVVSASATGQLLAFTSSQSAASGLQLPTAQSVSGFVRSLFDHDRMQGACSLDAIALVRIQDQHFDRTTFSSLSHSPLSLRARALDAPSQVTFPATQDLSVATAVNDAIRLCNRKAAHQDDSRAGQLVEASVDSHKSLSLIQIHVQNVRADEIDLMKTLASLDEVYPRNLVILQGLSDGHGTKLNKRQFAEIPFASSGNWTEPTGGVFARYQLFSTPLILTLLLVGGLLLPIVYFAVAQLAQIQTPDQMGVRKDPVSGDKKNQ